MPSMNKVILIGHLGHDPEIKYTQNNTAVANFSVATSERWQDKASGEWQEKTEWHRCNLWGQAVDRVQQKCHKGTLVYVEGRIETRKWKDKDGNDRQATEIKADKVFALSKDEQDAAPKKPFTPAPAPQDDDDDSSLPF